MDHTIKENGDKWAMHPLLIMPIAFLLGLILGKLINR